MLTRTQTEPYQRGARDREGLSRAFRPGGQSALHRDRPRSYRQPGANWLMAALAGAAVLGATALATAAAARRAERRHPPRGRFVTVDGVRLHVIEQGNGTPVLFLHGNGAMADDWIVSDVMHRTAAAGFRAIAIDRPGFGWSARPRGRTFSPEAQARLMRGACEMLHAEQPVVVGHSWGTLVALAMALEAPRAVRGLVLIGGYYFPTARLDAALLSPPAIPVIGDMMRYTVSPLLTRALLPLLTRRVFAPRPVPWQFRDRFPMEMALRPAQLRAAAAESALMIPAAARLQARYFALGVPLVLMAGDDDRIVDPGKQTLQLQRHVPSSVLHMVPGGGHMLHYLVPQQVVEAIRAIDQAEGGRPAVAGAALAASPSPAL